MSEITVAGIKRPFVIEEISLGCSFHGAPLCTVLRLTDTGDLLHIHGQVVSVEVSSATETAEKQPPSVLGASESPERPSAARKEQPGYFPPEIIKSWIQGQSVDTDSLVNQLRAWADYFA